jgi:hypothetical protein
MEHNEALTWKQSWNTWAELNLGPICFQLVWASYTFGLNCVVFTVSDLLEKNNEVLSHSTVKHHFYFYFFSCLVLDNLTKEVANPTGTDHGHHG